MTNKQKIVDNIIEEISESKKQKDAAKNLLEAELLDKIEVLEEVAKDQKETLIYDDSKQGYDVSWEISDKVFKFTYDGTDYTKAQVTTEDILMQLASKIIPIFIEQTYQDNLNWAEIMTECLECLKEITG